MALSQAPQKQRKVGPRDSLEQSAAYSIQGTRDPREKRSRSPFPTILCWMFGLALSTGLGNAETPYRIAVRDLNFEGDKKAQELVTLISSSFCSSFAGKFRSFSLGGNVCSYFVSSFLVNGSFFHGIQCEFPSSRH